MTFQISCGSRSPIVQKLVLPKRAVNASILIYMTKREWHFGQVLGCRSPDVQIFLFCRKRAINAPIEICMAKQELDFGRVFS